MRDSRSSIRAMMLYSSIPIPRYFSLPGEVVLYSVKVTITRSLSKTFYFFDISDARSYFRLCRHLGYNSRLNYIGYGLCPPSLDSESSLLRSEAFEDLPF